MKVKELQKTVNISWSPAQQEQIYLAAGSAAQQIDTSGNQSVLEIYSTNFKDPSYDLELIACQQAPYKFQKVLWSPTGIGSVHQNGLIVGGCESGHLMVYSAAKMLAGQDGLVASQDKHTGSIRGLDYNPFQSNLLASCASESEILIWDLNNTTTPMAPGTKSQPLEDIQNVSWNRQVQHILASVFSTRCVIWDLRKNEQIIKLSDTQSRVRWRAMQWHPDIATQLWLASEDDQSPVVQLWDLRYATTPSKSYQIHQRGILGLTWCQKDQDLMVSCGKDNKIYCWNPNTDLPEGEILSEVATTQQWYSDVQWCPRNPALIASSSLEGAVSIYSLYGGTQQQVQTSNKIADSFPGMDQMSQAPVPQQTTSITYSDLKRAPKWMRKHSGVSFGFGGRLISFNQKQPHTISVHQVITEPELVERANSLEKTLQEGNFSEYCRGKADQMQDQHGRFLWYFLKAGFEINPREEMLNLLGYNKDDVTSKFQKYVPQIGENVEHLTNRLAGLTHNAENALFEAIAAGNKVLSEKKVPFKIPVGENVDGLITEAIISGNIEAAIEICIQEKRFPEALIIASIGGIDLLTKTQSRYLDGQNSELSNVISALVNQDWLDLTSVCTIDSWKQALVAALTHGDGQYYELCAKLGERLEHVDNIQLARNSVLCYICAGNLEKLVDCWLNLKKIETGNPNLKLTTKDLQELVEIVMLLKKSLEIRGNTVSPSGKLAEFLSEYAGLLAAQGALDTALEYIGPTEDSQLEDLRERLYYALGHKTQQPSAPVYQQQTSAYNNKPRYNQPRGSFSNPQMPPAPLNQQWNNQASTPMFNPVQQQTMPPQAVRPPSVNDSISHPPRPGSTGLPKSKYVLDPSVASNNPYGQSVAPAPMSSPYGQNVPTYGQPIAQQPAAMPFSPSNFNTNPLNVPTSAPYQPQQQPFVPTVPINNFMPGIPPIETTPLAPPPQQFNRNPTPPPGWNDPPALMSTRAQKKAEVPPPQPVTAPITHPLFGVDPNQNQNGYYDPSTTTTADKRLDPLDWIGLYSQPATLVTHTHFHIDLHLQPPTPTSDAMQINALLPLLALLAVPLTEAKSHRDVLGKRNDHHARAAAKVAHNIERREALAQTNPRALSDKPIRTVKKRGSQKCRPRGGQFSASASSAVSTASSASSASASAVASSVAAVPSAAASPSPSPAPASSEAAAPSPAAPSPSAAAPSPSANTGGGATGGNVSGAPAGRKAGASGEETLAAFSPHISWFWNYQSTTYGSGDPNLIYMPTLWGNGNTGSQDWNRLEAFKSMNWNPQYVQGFYEPDCSPPMSSAIDPWTAAALWKSTIYPWKWKGATLVSPGMCKQADEDWLTPFKQAIGDDFMWDITSVHINKVDMDGVRKVLDHYWNTYGKPMFVTEFACVDDQNGFTPCTDQGQINNYINGIVDILQNDGRVLAYSMSEGMGLGDVWPPWKDGQLSESGRTYVNAISKY